MAAGDKDFVVKNGLVVNTDFSTNGSQVTISTINSTSNGFFANSIAIKLGNSTVNSTINSTAFSGTANNSDRLGGTAAASYALKTDTTFIGTTSVALNRGTGALTLTGVSIDGTADNANKLGTAAAADYAKKADVHFIGTTSVALNRASGSLSLTGVNIDGNANNSPNLGGVAASNYVVNTESRTLSGNLNFTGTNNMFQAGFKVGPYGAGSPTSGTLGLEANTTEIRIGNTSTMTRIVQGAIIFPPTTFSSSAPTHQSVLGSDSLYVGNTTVSAVVNATVYTGRSADSDKLAGTAAANFVQNTDSRILSGNLYFTGTNTVYFYGYSIGTDPLVSILNANTTAIRIGNTSVFATINSTAYTGLANNSNRLGGTLAASYVQNTDSRILSGNLNFTGTNNVSDTSHRVGSATVNSVFANSTTVTIGNTSVFSTINSTFYSGKSDNADKLGGTAAGSYVLSSVLSGYLTTTGTAADSSKLGGVVAANYIANTGNYTLAGAITFNGQVTHVGNVVISNSVTANGSFGTKGWALVSGGTGSANVYWADMITNATAQYAWTNTQSFSNSITFNGAIISTNTISANGSVGSAGQILVSGGASKNVYWGVSTFPNTDAGQGGIQFNNSLNQFGSAAGLSFAAVSNTLSIGTGGSIGIGSGTITATSFSGKSDDSNKLNGQLASFYAVKTDIPGYASASASGFLKAEDWTTFNNKQGPIPTACGSVTGLLSSTDWTTFNNKQATLGTASASASGILSSTDWTTFNNKQAALSTASASASGILSSTDWTTFNNKQAALSTASGSTSGILSATDWNTFNGKASATNPTISGATLSTTLNVTANTTFNSRYSMVTRNTTGSGTQNQSMDCSTGNYFIGSTFATGTTNITFANAPAGLYSMLVKLVYSGGAGAISWSNSPKWPGGIAPTPSTGVDIYSFFTDDGGTTWRGNLVMRDSK